HVLWHVLEATLRLLHPYMPFITEDIWQRMYKAIGAEPPVPSIMVTPWPKPAGRRDEAAEREVEMLTEIVRAIRNIRAEQHVEPGRRIDVVVQATPERRAALEAAVPHIQTLARVENLEIRSMDDPKPEKAIAAIAAGVPVYVPLAGLVDIEQEIERLEKELAEAEKQLDGVSARLANRTFVSQAPASVVEREREKQRELAERAELLRQRLAELREWAGGRSRSGHRRRSQREGGGRGRPKVRARLAPGGSARFGPDGQAGEARVLSTRLQR